MKNDMIQRPWISRIQHHKLLERERDKEKQLIKPRKTVLFHPSTLTIFSQLSEQQAQMPPQHKPKEFKDLPLAMTPTSTNEGERLVYIKKCAETLQAAHAERLKLVERLKEDEHCPSLHEIEYLRELYEEDLKLQQELSDALEAGRLNLERRRELELQRLEDYYYERYGFVFIDLETVETSTLPPPHGILDLNKNKTWDVCIANHDHEEMEKELERLRRRLNNLGKSPKIQNSRKDKTTSKSNEQKCRIL